MQRKFNFHFKGKAITGAKDIVKGSIRAKAKTSVVSVFSSALGNKKLKKNGDSGNGKDWHINARVLSNDQSARGGEIKPVKASLSQLLKLEQTFEDGAGAGKKNRKHKQRAKVNIPISLLNFLEKKERLNSFIKTKLKTVRFNNDLHGAAAAGDRVVARWRRVRSWRLVRIPSKLLVIRLKLKMIRSMMIKKVRKQFEQGVDECNERELCKKRILMGRRCKPLCSSGTLSYDTDGLLLPEI